MCRWKRRDGDLEPTSSSFTQFSCAAAAQRRRDRGLDRGLSSKNRIAHCSPYLPAQPGTRQEWLSLMSIHSLVHGPLLPITTNARNSVAPLLSVVTVALYILYISQQQTQSGSLTPASTSPKHGCPTSVEGMYAFHFPRLPLTENYSIWRCL